MERIYFMVHKGKRILVADFSNMNVQDKALIYQMLETAKKMVESEPKNTLLVITNLTNLGFNSEVANAFKEYANHNTPFVKASALVGVAGLQKVILMAVKQLTKRDYNLFNTAEEAADWLATQ